VSDITSKEGSDFLEYWDSLGFFENLKVILPPDFMMLFEIARNIFTDERSLDAMSAIEDIAEEEKVYEPDREENIQVNRVDKIAPLGDKMEIDTFKNINDMKKALPRELALDELFDVKLFTKTLIVQRFYVSESESFKPISTRQDDAGKDANRFEQKFYLLLDRSRSMDHNMRSLFSKCIVAEFLRRKLNSKAKLFYRPFDSKPGRLYRVEKLEDFPRLIERVLLTSTGGKSTNIEAAVFQAVKDIEYEKEMMNTEILIVTDGISKINKYEMKKRLGHIKLNVLKIGDELAEADFYSIKEAFEQENMEYNPSSYNVKSIKREMDNEGENMSMNDQRASRIVLDHSEKVFRDLKEVSKKFIEINDFHGDDLFQVTDETIMGIKQSLNEFRKIDISEKTQEEKPRIYKKLHFLHQYVQLLEEKGKSHKSELAGISMDILSIKEKFLKDPELLFEVMEVKEIDEDKKMLRLANKEAKKLFKEMEKNQKKLSIKEMKMAKLILAYDIGDSGSIGHFFILLIIKFLQYLKKVISAPLRIFSSKG
jgi:hypothetical protein